jgi:hypothetical protein
MQLSGKCLQLSASDLVGHINCRYLTQLDLKVTRGTLSKPTHYDPTMEVLIERGRRHEQGYLDDLRSRGRTVTAIEGIGVDPASVAATIAAMKQGACRRVDRGSRRRLPSPPLETRTRCHGEL